MNNFNIHLEIRNPKKQALDMKFEGDGLLPNEPANQRAEERIAGNHQESARVRVGRGNAVLDGQLGLW